MNCIFVNDKMGTPTYTHDFAVNVRLLIDKEQRGLFNTVCKGLTNRFEVATELLKILRLENDIKITEVNSEIFFSNEYFCS